MPNLVFNKYNDMRNLFIILICCSCVGLLAGCKKNETTNPDNFSNGGFVSYFSDTSEKATGGLPSDDDTLPFIEDVDWDSVGVFKKTGYSNEKFSLSMPEVRDQGRELNSCVGWAVGYGNLSSQYKTKTAKEGTFSPTYIWNQLNRGRNNEINIPEALELVQEQGCCKWEYMPGGNSSFTEQPSTIARENAKNFRLYDCYRFGTVDIAEIKRTLTDKKVPIIILVKTDIGFRQGKNANSFDELSDGRLLWKALSNQNVKFHALLISGYDDEIGAFELYNSWGLDWGTKGKGTAWINYDFLETVIVKNGKGRPEIYTGFLRLQDIFFGTQEQGSWKEITANAPTKYNVNLRIEDLSLRLEFDEGNSNSVTAEASHHFGASGLPTGMTFYDANYSEKSQSGSINGDNIVVNFPSGVFKGSISGDIINGTFTDTSTYTDRNSGLTTYPVILSTPIKLNRQE